MSGSTFMQAFEILQDRDAFFEKISKGRYETRVIWSQVLIIAILCFGYGLVMGSYNSLQQALLTGIKIWLLMFLTLLICFPSFFIVQLILGSRLRIKQLLILLLSGFVLVSTVMVAFAPIVLFFQLSSDNYKFLQLLHVFVFIFSGFYGMKIVLEALKTIFEDNQVYPKIGLTVFQIWVVIFAFVGMQLSWNLRPFIGSKDLPFELFRSETRGNFYTYVLGSVGQLMRGEHAENNAMEETVDDEAVPEPEGPSEVSEEQDSTAVPGPKEESTDEEN